MATIEKHEIRLDDHEKRIRTLEVDGAVFQEKVTKIEYWMKWGVAILGGSFLVELTKLVIER